MKSAEKGADESEKMYGPFGPQRLTQDHLKRPLAEHGRTEMGVFARPSNAADPRTTSRVGGFCVGERELGFATYNTYMIAYESRLSADRRWALSEGSRHFEDKSAVQETLRRIARRLDELGIPYAISGGMALFQHGYRRFTEDVDVLLTREGLGKVHGSLVGLGYVPTHAGSRNVRDAQTGVRIDFLVAGDFPGDGKPKPVAFPDPGRLTGESAPIADDGVRYLRPTTLIELKLASGMSSAARLRDLSDVLELIRVLELPASFAESLHPYVREKFLELHRAAGEQTEPG